MDIRKQPFAFYLLALLIGILSYPFIPVSILTLFVIIGVLYLLLIIILFKTRYRVGFSMLSLIGWMILGLIVTNLNTTISSRHYTHFVEDGSESQYINAVINEQINSNDKNKKYIAEITSISHKDQSIHCSGKILLYVNKIKHPDLFLLGNQYTLKIKIQTIPSPMNPHQFDYKRYLERNYILRTGYVERVVSEKAHTSLWYKIKNSNQVLAQKIDSTPLQPDSKEFLKAFLLGDRTEMSRDNIKSYSTAGIMHLIAISGMHVVIIFGFTFSISLFFLGNKNRKKVIIVSLIFVWIFGCFVGLTSSVMRACIMLTIYYIFELLKRNSNIYHSLSLSAILILLYNPYEIYSVGFQLSYTAVFFMAWLSPGIAKILKVKNTEINNFVIKPFSATLAAQVGVMPLVVYYFHQFSLLSVIANIFLIPYSFIITYASLLELGVVFLPVQLQEYSSFFYDFLVKILVSSSRKISSLDFFMIKNIPLSLIELGFILSGIIGLKFFLDKPKTKNTFPVLICVVAFLICRLFFDLSDSGKQNFIVFDNRYPLVGLREGKSMVFLIDKQDNMDEVKQYIVDPYLTGERISKIEYRVIDEYEIYKWKGKSILFLTTENNIYMNKVDYIISRGALSLLKNKNKAEEIIIVGRVSKKKLKDLSKYSSLSKVWITQTQGAFIGLSF